MRLRIVLPILLAAALGEAAVARPQTHDACDAPMFERLLAGPLVEVPSNVPGDAFVVLYSGDGGWAQADCEFSHRLAAKGLPVIGVNSVRYFSKARSPEAAAADLSRTIDLYARRWGRPKVVLMGYSFGASALPLIAENLPAAERAKVSEIALAGPGEAADMVLRPRTWFGKLSGQALPVEPALERLADIPTVCIYGDHDPAAACPRLKTAHLQPRPVAADHRFRGAYQAVVDAVLAPAA